jgi:hypothetical protein
MLLVGACADSDEKHLASLPHAATDRRTRVAAAGLHDDVQATEKQFGSVHLLQQVGIIWHRVAY